MLTTRYTSHHNPFGMVMPGRNWEAGSEEEYGFGFNGNVNINEINGDDSFIDFDQRGYDCRISVWWSVDPLFAKYPSLSPYAFVGSNPILNKENQGRDFEVYIDHETKTILIKATYYTPKGDIESFNSASQATQFWNEQSGLYQYKVGEGDEAIYYDIEFNLQVNNELENTSEALEEGNVVVKSPVLDYEGNVISTIEETIFAKLEKGANTYQVVEDGLKDNEGKPVNGITKEGDKIAVIKSRANENTGSHEIGHTLNLGHLWRTIMSKKDNRYRRENTNTRQIGSILGSVGLGKSKLKSGGGDGYIINSKGQEPEDFNTGKVTQKQK